MPEPARRYRKRPIVIEAMQWTGDNAEALTAWTHGRFDELDPEDRTDNPEATGAVWVAANGVWIPVEPGEWIIHDSKGFYPCKADVFEQTYELVGDES